LRIVLASRWNVGKSFAGTQSCHRVQENRVSEQNITPFIVCKPAEDGISWPVFDSTDGSRGINFFTSEGKAKTWIEGKRDGYPGYRVGQMQAPEFMRWLRANMAEGVSNVFVDPDPAQQLNRAVPISTFLETLTGNPLELRVKVQASPTVADAMTREQINLAVQKAVEDAQANGWGIGRPFRSRFNHGDRAFVIAATSLDIDLFVRVGQDKEIESGEGFDPIGNRGGSANE
jgi:hypothetical protein